MKFVPLARVALIAAPLAAALSGGCRATGVALSSSAIPSPAAGTFTRPVRTRSRLDNGVQVVVEENHASPAVAIGVWIAAGAADDPPGLGGAAHLIQTMVLRGTRRRPGGAARDVESAGGRLGAWTGPDETVFQAATASAFFADALDAIADAITAPTFEPAELERARTSTLDDIARAEADPSAVGAAALRAAVFAGEGYGKPILGSAAEVSARSRAELVARFGQLYVGANTSVVVVGDVDAAVVQAAVARAFAALPRGRTLARVEARVGVRPARLATDIPVLPAGARAEDLWLGFRAPALAAGDAAALDVLAAAAARGEASRFHRELVQSRQVATAARAFTFASRAGALLALAVTPQPGRLESAAGAAVEASLRLGREPLAPDELERARQAVSADVAAGEAGIEGHARRLGFALAIAGDVEYESIYRERLATLSADDVAAVAAKVLRPDTLTVVAGSADAPAELRRRVAARVASASTAGGAAVPGRAAAVSSAGDVVRAVVAGGARVLVVRAAAAPTTAVAATWAPGGEAPDPGAAALMASLFDRGTRTQSALDIANDLQSMGGTLAAVADAGRLTLRAEFLPGAWPRGVALLAECVMRPSFPLEALDVERRILLERARAGDADPTRIAWRLFARALSPRAPYRFDPLGPADALAGFGRVRLLDLYRRRFPLSRLIVAVVGDVEPRDVVAVLDRAFADAPAFGEPPSGPDTADAAAAPQLVTAEAGKDEAEVLLGFPGLPAGDPDRPAAEVLAAILDGDAGLLKPALAGDPPLATRATASAAPRTERGFVAVGLATSVENVDRAVAAVRDLLAKVAAGATSTPSSLADGARVSAVARRLAGAAAVSLGSRAAVASALAADEAAGLPAGSYRQTPAALARVTAADVARAARRIFDPRREITAIVRPPDESVARLRAGRGSR